jgi:hypothetical protein
LSSAPGREVELEFFRALGRAVDGLLVPHVFLVRVDHLDAGAAERVEQVVELVGGCDFRRKELVHLVVQQVAFFLADVDELPYFVVFFFNRHAYTPTTQSIKPAVSSIKIRCASTK